MTNKELSQAIRNDIKKIGYTSRQISVKVRDCGYSTSVHITIKDATINIHDIEAVALKYKSIDRDQRTYEILEGCNTYVFVKYEYGVLEDAAKALIPICENVLSNNKYHNRTIAKNDNTCVSLVIDDELGSSVVMHSYNNKYSPLKRVWIHSITDFAIAMFKYKTYGSIA